MVRKEEFNPYKMYRMETEPPEMTADEYISLYKETGNSFYLDCFFHRYENWVSKKATGFCNDYGQERHFEDMKQVLVMEILRLIPRYNPATGVSFIKYIDVYLRPAARQFVRLYGGTFTPTPEDYKILRKVSAIYYHIDNREKSEDERVQAVREQSPELSEEDVALFIEMGKHFKYPMRLDYNAKDDDGFKTLRARLVHDTDPPIVEMIIRTERYKIIVDLIESELSYKERSILLDAKGIRCLYCGRVGKERSKEEICGDFEIGRNQTVDNIVKRIGRKLKMSLEELGW